METLYRKVAVSDRLPNDGNTVFILNEKDEWQTNGYFDRGEWFNDFDNECPCFPTHWLEPIPDTTAQLQADKAELLEALGDCEERLKEMNKKLFKITNYSHISAYFASKLNFLIQKHKK